MASEVSVALTGGVMYDRLYERLTAFEREAGVRVEVRFHGPHPQLNAHLAEVRGAGFDLISTHSKYAPSQREWLAPLEGFDTSDFFDPLLQLASIDGALYGLPRNIDLRLLHYRTDAMDSAPATWDELVVEAKRLSKPPGFYGLVFTGMESGLFGMFFELVEAAGGRLFPASLAPDLNNDAGRWALGVLRSLYASGAAPREVADWQYDDVHRAYRSGLAAMVMDWPGYYGSYCEAGSAVRGGFAVARMPAGPSGRVCCYAGSHTFALTHAGAANEAARELLRFLTDPEQQMMEAERGSVPVRRSVMERRRGAVAGEEAARLKLLEGSIARDLIIPPKLAYYPEIEDILWRTVRAGMTGELEIAVALSEIERRIRERVEHAAGR